MSTSDTQSDVQNQDSRHESPEGIADGFGGCGSQTICNLQGSCKLQDFACKSAHPRPWLAGRLCSSSGSADYFSDDRLGGLQATCRHARHSFPSQPSFDTSIGIIMASRIA